MKRVQKFVFFFIPLRILWQKQCPMLVAIEFFMFMLMWRTIAHIIRVCSRWAMIEAVKRANIQRIEHESRTKFVHRISLDILFVWPFCFKWINYCQCGRHFVDDFQLIFPCILTYYFLCSFHAYLNQSNFLSRALFSLFRWRTLFVFICFILIHEFESRRQKMSKSKRATESFHSNFEPDSGLRLYMSLPIYFYTKGDFSL